jgi:hypothetical protein
MQSTQYTLKNGDSITISHGNSKIGKCTNWNLPPILSCQHGVPCAKDCYALQYFKQYPNVKKAYLGNLYAVQSCLDEVFDFIRYHLSVQPTPYVRIHCSGDFISQEYLDRWIDIAINFPDIQFLAFTKRYNFDYSHVPSNLKIVFSVWPGLPLPEQPCKGISGYAYMLDKNNIDDRIPVNSTLCAGKCVDCHVCWNIDKISSKSVYFHKH